MDENELLRANPATVGVVASAVGESSSSSGVDGAAEEDGENQLAEVSEEDLEEGWGTTSEEDE